MHFLADACFVLAALNAFLGTIYLFLHLRLRLRTGFVYLAFALLCFSFCAYDVFCAGLYLSESVAEGIFWQRLQLDSTGPLAIALTWFVGQYTGQQRNRVLRFLMIWFAVLLVVALVAPAPFTLSESVPAIKRFDVFGHAITYYEVEAGLVFSTTMVSGLLGFLYLFYLLVRRYRETRSRPTLAILGSLIAYFASIASDTAVTVGLSPFIYISEYAFFIIVVAMAYALLSQFVDLHLSVEDLNLNLERKVEDRTEEVQRLNVELRRLADLDGLTGIYNRRFFNEYLEIEMRRARNELQHLEKLRPTGATAMNFGLAIIDVDDFKKVNDTFGHVVGDRVLVQMAEVIRAAMFTRDVLCRYGGEEFGVILTKTSKDGVRLAVDKIRKEVADHEFRLEEGSPPLRLTISIGVASFDEASEANPGALVRLADERLYRAKTAGKNLVVLAD